MSDRIAEAVEAWAGSQVRLVLLAAELCDAPDWIVAGSPTAAHYLAAIADVEACTAREWIRVGKRVRGLPTISELFVSGDLSYSKVRALVAIATPESEAELAYRVGTTSGRRMKRPSPMDDMMIVPLSKNG